MKMDSLAGTLPALILLGMLCLVAAIAVLVRWMLSRMLAKPSEISAVEWTAVLLEEDDLQQQHEGVTMSQQFCREFDLFAHTTSVRVPFSLSEKAALFQVAQRSEEELREIRLLAGGGAE